MNLSHEISMDELWNYFTEISKIPRLSKSEEKIIDYLLEFARINNLHAVKDDVGNILIRKPASAGMEKCKTVILQSHLDMVGEKDPSSSHDFDKDPIIPVIDEQWIRANFTTLGADDGIGIAAEMVILADRSLLHGPLECLFTVDEESGMTGAKNLGPGFLQGKILINLDSEDEGELFIGCAGGIDTIATFLFNTEKPEGSSQSYRISVHGLKGGHSGDEIHKSPGNSIKVLNQFLLEASKEFGIQIEIFDGGNMRNAIPRDAVAVITVPGGKSVQLEKYFSDFSSKISEELRKFEPDLKLSIGKAELPSLVLPVEDQIKLLKAIEACPHGVIHWSPTIDGLVETSTNLASVKFAGSAKAIVTTSQRSSVKSAKTEIAGRIKNCFTENGALVEHNEGYPGWTPNPDSEILNITKAAYYELFGEEPVVRAIHAGLECGLFLEKYPELDMISFGPTIKGAHTPSERIHIGSTEKFWNLLLYVLEKIPEE